MYLVREKPRSLGGTYWGNGAQWGASAAADGYTVNGTPAAGAVVVFAAGQSSWWRMDC